MDLTQISPEFVMSDELTIIENLQNTSWNAIPSLNQKNLEFLKDGQLVRFRGMIQDMHGSEYYIDSYVCRNKKTNENIVKCGKYMEYINYGEDEYVEDNIDQKELQTFYVISTPGENQWVKDEVLIVTPEEQVQESPKTSKRNYDEEEPMDESNKKLCTKQAENVEMEVLEECQQNIPLNKENGKACIIKVYTNANDIKLNEVHEFIGFLRLDRKHSNLEEEIHNPPSSLIPRIHCITFKKLIHENPLVGNLQCNFIQIRKELMILLTQLLLGDELAAEYLLCHLISSVYIRKDFKPLGKFSLNLLNIPIVPDLDYVKEVYDILQLLVTKSLYFPLTINNLNETTFIPKKDYTTNKLNSGILQLSPNTHVLIDETKLQAGSLNQAGIQGVQAIANVINKQTMSYDFSFYNIDFDCDIPFLVTSEGKSMLPTDFHMVLKWELTHVETFKEILEALHHFLKPELLKDIRQYLTVCRFMSYELEDNMLELIQDKFLDMRKKGATADDLHSLLVLSRLISLSYGKNKADEECWKIACTLEEKRQERIK